MQPITFKEANQRYLRCFFPVMLLYIFFCFAGPLVLQSFGNTPNWTAALVAVLTGIPIVAVFWLMTRFLRETDEYTQKTQAVAMLNGGAITLSLAVIIGFLELYNAVPKIEHFPLIMMVAPTFFGAWGLCYAHQVMQRE